MSACWRKQRVLHRWAKFSAVGVLGFCVQLSCVSIFVSAFKLDPLLATFWAVEVTVLHNFAWHYFLTWNDRRFGKWQDFLPRLLAFNATNGMISLAGNVFFVWLIVERGHVSWVLGNLLAITVCSWMNFVFSDKLVFRVATTPSNSCGISTRLDRAVRLIAPILFCIVVGEVGAQAQDAASPKFTLFAGPGIVRT